MKSLLRVTICIALGFSLGWLASVLRYDLEPLRRPSSSRVGSPLDHIDLSPEQSLEVQKIRERFAEDRKRLQNELDIARVRFEQVLGTTQDREALQGAWSALQDLEEQFKQRRFEQMVAIHQILTPEQIRQLDQERTRHRHLHPGPHRHPQQPVDRPDSPPPPPL